MEDAAWLSLVEPSHMPAAHETFLHEKEKESLSKVPSKERILSYLMGRYAAKEAFRKALPEAQNPREIAIIRGVFYQPVIVSSVGHSYQVSISHCQGLGGALLFPEIHPMGMDIETIQKKEGSSSDAIKKEMTEAELFLGEKLFKRQGENVYLTCLWTIKESLAKILRTGLTLNLKLLEIKSMEKKGGCFESQFIHFTQYKTLSWKLGDHMISISLPKNTKTNLEHIIF